LEPRLNVFVKTSE